MSKAKLRELSVEELSLVCGGFWGDSIGTLPPIYAEPPPVYEYPEWPDHGPPDWYDPYDPYPDDGGGGGGGGSSGDTYASVDAQTDALARQVTDLIKADSDYQKREIGAIIYKDNVTGEIKTSALAYGSLSNPGAISYPLGAWGITADEILGIIHSHPAGIFPANTHEVNKYPSDNRTVNGVHYTGHDWATADLLRDNGMNSNTFRYYIIGPDHVTREYDFNDRDAVTPGGAL